ncbi:hypothetical protein SISSUDRAFT_1121697 [Sistotremastrum suecicum HHB10207 ss-3]|uniref:Uncharacterized protein n=1 Tax=Sistotremastrum suecicum HHB10207 ss-3 TaxID=1314776 RepID=A0A166AFL9_9AGAM|nr:hypothetical protein SISSUDRAFT_1121697 [Sistotremastrum suecicum HHB10207 ss-3]
MSLDPSAHDSCLSIVHQYHPESRSDGSSELRLPSAKEVLYLRKATKRQCLTSRKRRLSVGALESWVITRIEQLANLLVNMLYGGGVLISVRDGQGESFIDMNNGWMSPSGDESDEEHGVAKSTDHRRPLSKVKVDEKIGRVRDFEWFESHGWIQRM